jgi:hypothetical protein
MSAAWKPLVVSMDTLTPGLKRFFKKAGDVGGSNTDKESADFKAKRAMALQLLNFCVNGSAKERVKPPIRFGILRASGSAFVEGEMVGDTKANNADGTPNEAYNAGAGTIAVGFNTAYAAKLHEDKNWVPGGEPPSPQAERNPAMLEDVGNKYVEKHLVADKETLLAVYAEEFKREAGTA